MRTPKVTISDFTGINNNGMYFLYGFYPKNLNGSRVLSQGFQTVVKRTKSDTGFSGLALLNDITSFDYFANGFSIGTSTSRLFGINYISPSTSVGLMHTILNSGVGSVYTTITNNHLLYTGSNKMGMGYYLRAESATSTSATLEDPVTLTNVDLTDATYGFAATPVTGANKAYNLTKKEEYTITSITVSGSTINFSAAVATPQAGDIIMVFNDNRFDFGTTDAPSNHFKGQTAPSNWNRRAVLMGDEYWVLNGNYIGTLNIDETTFSATSLRLPYGCNAVSHDVNQDQMLVASEAKDGFVLSVYSASSNQFVNEIRTTENIKKVKSYKSGWLVLTQNGIFFTGGSTLEPVFHFIDFEFNSATATDMEVYDNKIFFSILTSGVYTTRQRAGYYVYDFNDGLVYIASRASKTTNRKIETGNLIKVLKSGTSSTILASYSDSASGDVFVSTIQSQSNPYCSALMCIKLPKKMQINEVEININKSAITDYYSTSGSVLTLHYGDGRRKPMIYSQCGGSDTQALLTASVNYEMNKFENDDLVEMINGNTSGERSYISGVANPGATNQTITLAPDLSANPTTSSIYRVYSMKKADSINLNLREDIPFNTRFTIKDFNSDMIWLEVYGYFPGDTFDIHSINIY